VTETGVLPARAVSVARMFRDRVAATPTAEAFRFPTAEGWESVTWRQAEERVTALAAGLLALGIRSQERVAIASNTRIEWLYADLAITCAGAATTTVYPTTGAEDVGYILADSGSRIVFAEDDAQIEKLRARREHLPDLARVITLDGTTDGEWVLGLDDVRTLGTGYLAEHPSAVDDAVDAVQPEDLATLIYTSGTTGRPKGVELPHRCWTYIGAGYHHLPEATADVLSADGWLATGDVGELDEQGRLRITDRKKDLIKTSGSKYIAPQPIEVLFKAVCPLGSQMVVHAEGRQYATALITLDPEALVQWGRAQALGPTDYEWLTADPAVRTYVQAGIDEVNGRLNRWETIKDFRILDHDFSVEAGELTPSMKVRRKVVETTYRPLLDSMYPVATSAAT
jgi:long-subunit acyl-CoA synthetase (AMP-forming)